MRRIEGDSMAAELIVLGEFDSHFMPHLATNAAISHSASRLDLEIVPRWVSTEVLLDHKLLDSCGLWVAPGSPYRSLVNAIEAIRIARENGLPCLGTCGGFQHMVIEYARHGLNHKDAQHAEYDPYASDLFVSRLECSMVGKEMDLELAADSKAAEFYGSRKAKEQYYCNFGVAKEYIPLLQSGRLRWVGRDALDEARILELSDHPFYIGTLFVPQAKSTPENPHPLVTAFLRACGRYSSRHSNPF